VAGLLEISHSTVFYIWNKYTGAVDDRKRSGRPITPLVIIIGTAGNLYTM